MHAEQLIREGDLQGALRDLQEQVRKQPENSRYRTFLFQLLAVLGQWERALNQLSVLGELDVSAWPTVHLYRPAIQCEVLRADIFSGRRKPMILGEPPQWVALSVESLRLMGEGRYGEATSLRNQAFEQAAESSGTINECPFQWIADADSFLGPILEVILNGQYYWVPFEQIQSITMEPPTDLRDLVWLPARLVWVNGGQAFGLIPTRYAGSEKSQDSLIQMARKTEWQELAEDVYRGLGQRVLVTDQDEYPLLEVRQISINSLLDSGSGPV
jgi:type VI secretion system protein ImpE